MVSDAPLSLPVAPVPERSGRPRLDGARSADRDAIATTPRDRLGATVSHAVRAIGSARGSARLVGQLTRTVATPTALVGAVVEATWLATHVATYPLGLVSRGARPDRRGYRLGHLKPHQRGLVVSDVEAAGTPILLIHGLLDNRSIFTVLRRRLRGRGFERVTTINHSPFIGDIPAAAAQLADEVENLVSETGYERIHVIGHSLGGLIARYYVTRLGGDERVHTLVTLGTPHQGTYAAYLSPFPMARQMRPGSALLAELDRPVRSCRTRFIAYWSDLDEAVVPQSHGALVHPDLAARNMALHGVGHLSLPIVGSVVRDIASALAVLDPDGGVHTAGVEPLPTARRGDPSRTGPRRQRRR